MKEEITEKIAIQGDFKIDYNTFKKTPEEKSELKKMKKLYNQKLKNYG